MFIVTNHYKSKQPGYQIPMLKISMTDKPGVVILSWLAAAVSLQQQQVPLQLRLSIVVRDNLLLFGSSSSSRSHPGNHGGIICVPKYLIINSWNYTVQSKVKHIITLYIQWPSKVMLGLYIKYKHPQIILYLFSERHI